MTGTATPDDPLVSYILLAYQHERFIEVSLRCALAQTYRPLEILILDDASRDRTVEIVEKILAAYQGPHQVSLIKNQDNVGMTSQINKGASLARGAFLIIAAGDDTSEPQRTERYVQAWRAQPDVMAVYSNAAVIDADGKETGTLFPDDYALPPTWSATIANSAIPGCTEGWDASLLKRFDPLQPRSVEDLVMLLRAQLVGRATYIPERLVKHRRHNANSTVWANEVHDWKTYLKQVEVNARHCQQVYGAYLHDLERFFGDAPPAEVRRAMDQLRALMALFALREASVAGKRLHGADLRFLWSLRRRIGARPLISTALLGTAPGVARTVRTLAHLGDGLRRTRDTSAPAAVSS